MNSDEAERLELARQRRDASRIQRLQEAAETAAVRSAVEMIAEAETIHGGRFARTVEDGKIVELRVAPSVVNRAERRRRAKRARSRR